MLSGRIMGRKVSECAQITVIYKWMSMKCVGEGGGMLTSIPGKAGWHKLAPAAREYAVDPVGVATQRPSAAIEVRNSSFAYSSAVVIVALGPLSTTISLRTTTEQSGRWVSG